MDAPDSPKQIVRVTIFNQSYSVTTSGNPSDMEALAYQVDELMSSIARRAGNLDTARTAVLACLHLADRLRAAERELGLLKDTITHKTRDFALLLDAALPAHESD
jgi:cell division protein ZapA